MSHRLVIVRAITSTQERAPTRCPVMGQVLVQGAKVRKHRVTVLGQEGGRGTHRQHKSQRKPSEGRVQIHRIMYGEYFF